LIFLRSDPEKFHEIHCFRVVSREEIEIEYLSPGSQTRGPLHNITRGSVIENTAGFLNKLIQFQVDACEKMLLKMLQNVAL